MISFKEYLMLKESLVQIPLDTAYEIFKTELMDEPLHPYEESIKIPTFFKEYIILNEWTRELMPEIYAALEKYDDPMVGVHFSKGIPYKGDEEETTPHIGLNLKPFHNDPLGIYTFPKDYVLDRKLKRNRSFAGLSNYYIVKPSQKARILNLSTMTEEDARKILIDMGIDTPNGESWLASKEIYHNSGYTIGHRFWGVLEKVRKQMTIKNRNLSWNVLFKNSGYNVLFDDGDSIIHSNEPSQIVYLDSSAMEILDQGKQDNPTNKVYSFFIQNFAELKPEKTKDHWNREILKLKSNRGYDLIILINKNFFKIEVSIKDQISGKSKPLGEYEYEMGGDLGHFIYEIKATIASVESEYSTESEKQISPILEQISKRFNIKLKKDERGDWEIRQKYQDADKDYIITFYIRYHKDEIFFVLNKKQKSMNYNTFGYNEAARVQYRERYTPEQIVEMGLKELEYQRYGSASINHNAMKTIDFLRKRVFRI